MRCRGDQLMMEDQYAVDSICPKCVELQRMCEQYKDLLRRRRQMLTKSHDLHDRLDRVSQGHVQCVCVCECVHICVCVELAVQVWLIFLY